MKLLRFVGLLLFLCAFSGLAQTPPVINSFSQNGELICTNLQPGSTAVVEWAPSLSGPWTNSWAGLDAIVVGTNGSIHVSVPMFYRVRSFGATNPVAIEASVPALAVAEGSSTNFSVRLTAQPAGTTVVTLASGNTAKATVAPPTLTFNTVNWSTPQTVTVSGVDDGDTSNENVTLTLSSAGLSNQTVSVTVIDDDTIAIEPSTMLMTVAEGGSSNFTVRLTAQPAANTTVNVASSDTSKATASVTSLTFSTVNWSTPQTVTVNGIQDIDVVNGSATINLTSSGLPTKQVNVTVVDDDVLAIVTSTSSLNVGEGSMTTFTVRLSHQPASNKTVSVASGNTSKATVSPGTLIFTPANYATPQTVTVTGVSDLDLANDNVTVTVSSTDLTNQTVDVTVIDDD